MTMTNIVRLLSLIHLRPPEGNCRRDALSECFFASAYRPGTTNLAMLELPHVDTMPPWSPDLPWGPLFVTRFFVFSGKKYGLLHINDEGVDRLAHSVASNYDWPALKDAGFHRVDAALPISKEAWLPSNSADAATEAYLFSGMYYIRVKNIYQGRTSEEIVFGPARIQDHWPSLREAGFYQVDAVLPVPGSGRRRAWFFSGERYVQVEINPGREDKIVGGPDLIKNGWPSLVEATKKSIDGGGSFVDFTASISGAMSGSAYNPDTTYFFSGNQYVAVEMDEAHNDTLARGPYKIADHWPSLDRAGFLNP